MKTNRKKEMEVDAPYPDIRGEKIENKKRQPEIDSDPRAK